MLIINHHVIIVLKTGKISKMRVTSVYKKTHVCLTPHSHKIFFSVLKLMTHSI